MSWLDEPVPEYDQDDGTEIGTRTRGRAIATNPLTIIGVGAAGLVGAEVLLPVAVEEVVPVAVEQTGIGINSARGMASQARVLEDLGLARNTQAVEITEGRSIPDALTIFTQLKSKIQHT